MSKLELKKATLFGWLFTYLFVTKVFIWHDKFLEYDQLWGAFVHYFIFRDSFIILFMIGTIFITTVIDNWCPPLRKLSELQRWIIFHIATYVVFALLYITHNWVLSHFFDATFETWLTHLLRWTILYIVVQFALYVKYWMPKPSKKAKKIAAGQRVRLKSGEEAIVTDIFNNGERYKIEVPIGGGDYVQRKISSNGIKSVFEIVETELDLL